MTSAGAATAMASRTPEDALAALARVQARMREFRQAKQDAVQGQAKAADAMAGRAGRHVDLPPEIRIARGDVDLEERAITDDRGRVIGRCKGAAVTGHLGRYLRRREITRLQWAAGQRFVADVECSHAGVVSQLDPDRFDAPRGAGGGAYGPSGVSVDAFAALMARNARGALGAHLEAVVLWVGLCGGSAASWAESVGKPSRDGIAVLRVALDVLVGHYRLDS